MNLTYRFPVVLCGCRMVGIEQNHFLPVLMTDLPGFAAKFVHICEINDELAANSVIGLAFCAGRL